MNRLQGIDSVSHVDWRAGTTTLYSYSVPSLHRLFKNSSTGGSPLFPAERSCLVSQFCIAVKQINNEVTVRFSSSARVGSCTQESSDISMHFLKNGQSERVLGSIPRVQKSLEHSKDRDFVTILRKASMHYNTKLANTQTWSPIPQNNVSCRRQLADS